MTTSFVVKTHDWSVSVVSVDTDVGGNEIYRTEDTVPPNSEVRFAIWDGRYAIVKELPIPPSTTEEGS